MGVSARACLDRLLPELDNEGFGFKMQAVAAHILLRLGHEVLEVKRFGHPDMVSVKDGVEYRFEVEAEVRGHRKRMLEPADFVGLTATGGVGVFCVSCELPETVLGRGAGIGVGSPRVALRGRDFGGTSRHTVVRRLDADSLRLAGNVMQCGEGTIRRAVSQTGSRLPCVMTVRAEVRVGQASAM